MPPKSKVVVRGLKKKVVVEALASDSASNSNNSVPDQSSSTPSHPALSLLPPVTESTHVDQAFDPVSYDAETIQDEEKGVDVDADQEYDSAPPARASVKGKGKAIQGGEMKGMQNVAQLENRFGKDIAEMAAQEYKGKGITDSIASVSVRRLLYRYATQDSLRVESTG